MSAAGNEELISALHQSVRDLQQGIDMHSCLIASILGHKVDDIIVRPLLESCPTRSREFKVKEALKEAIDVLEQSRKSFKSKQLELLRKRLTQVLVDTQ